MAMLIFGNHAARCDDAFGVKVLDVPDSHRYFQAPRGQVFRLVGINEDHSKHEAHR